MFANIRWGTYVFFAVMNLAIVVPGTWLLFPGTKKYSLEDVRTATDSGWMGIKLTISSTLSLLSPTTKASARSKSLFRGIFLPQALPKPSVSWVADTTRSTCQSRQHSPKERVGLVASDARSAAAPRERDPARASVGAWLRT